MVLFINNSAHPNVYKNKETINEPNQQILKRNFLSELVEDQKKANETLHQSLLDIKKQYQQHEHSQTQQWREMNDLLSEFMADRQQKQFENQVLSWLSTIEESDRKIQASIEDENLFKKVLSEQMNAIDQSNQEMILRLDKNELANADFTRKMGEQMDIHEKLAVQLATYETFQKEVIGRLDDQEALTEKILRQVNHIRSILFERTHYLAKKIEDGYQLTSSYIYHLMTGSDKPFTFFMNQKKDDREKKLD